MLKRLLWPIILTGLAIWSLMAWLVHSLVGWGGNAASANADIVTQVPEAVEWLSWLAMFGTNFAEWVVIGIWAIGALVAIALGFAGGRLLPQAGSLAGRLRI